MSASDTGQTKAQPGTATQATFRSDVVANGNIDATDISIVKSRAGNSLPPPLGSSRGGSADATTGIEQNKGPFRRVTVP